MVQDGFQKAMLNLGTRSVEKEFMDAHDFAGDELAESFSFIRLINRFGGGQKAVLSGLSIALKGWPAAEPVEILDVGCGIGDIGTAILRWGNARGLKLRYLGLERSENTLALARKRSDGRNIRFILGDLFDENLPKADLIIASMVLHHLDDEDVVRAIAHLAGRSRKALIINELERSWMAYALCSIMTIFLRHPASRSDALLSVRKGFTLPELRSFFNRAGVTGTARAALGWRLMAVVPPPDSPGKPLKL
ncbi:MAG: methyltransferase domain-containing protein [Candidatus Riflebacteria bacterium]|nr:methyltransferase domain-containing protein [Candidatus Riflebacteria bacterium]